MKNVKLILEFSFLLVIAYVLNAPKAFSQQSTRTTDSLYRAFQISFVPYLSTNGYLSDKITNDLSINILAGYIKEVRKAEFSGMLNLVKGNAGKFQAAGVGNLVGGTATGVQAAGTFNMSDKLIGIQAAGVLNYTGNAKGMQVSGMVNQAAKGKCIQFAGLINNSGDSAILQAAGLINNTLQAEKFQAAGLVNNAMNVSGFQIAGLVNNAPKVNQFQIAGLVNNTREETGFQIAGLVNNASIIRSCQIAGLVNNAREVHGLQAAGLVNRASYFKGLQIGLINFADSCNGIPIGLINWVKNGYHKLEISGDELFYTNIAFRSGVQKFHGIITAGISPENFSSPLWTYGSGIGTSFNLGSKTLFDIDFLFQNVIKEEWIDNNFLYKIYVGIDHKLIGKTSLSIGATYNFLTTDIRQKGYAEKYADIAPYHFTNDTYGNRINLKTWAGVKIGLRFF